MFKRLSDRPVAEVQNQQVEKWKEEDLLKKCVDARDCLLYTSRCV